MDPESAKCLALVCLLVASGWAQPEDLKFDNPDAQMALESGIKLAKVHKLIV
jgi:hypothetical protein